VDLLGVGLLVSGFLVAIEYLPMAFQRIALALFAGLMLWRIGDVAFQLLNGSQYQVGWWESVRKQSRMVMFLLSGALACLLPRITEPAVRAVRLIVAGFAFSALWIVPQLLHLALVRQSDDAASPHPSAHIVSSADRRIVWILFDELSYKLTIEHPVSGVKLPNFARMRAESVSFSNLKPSGYWTEAILPSLFLGRRIEQVRSTAPGDLWYKDETQSRWQSFDPKATLFALAQRSGWSTGVDGWYNPYCHILASVLDVCYWEPSHDLQMEAYGASEERSVLANAAILPNRLLARLTRRAGASENIQTREYRSVMGRASELIENSQVRFVFLHLPVPHPPGIYDRQHHALRPDGTYLDNLVLADDTLGMLMQKIDATPSASRTTVIVSSDHSWRIPMWKPSQEWSAEEERASGGYFDERPVLLVHFPGQTTGNDLSSALPALLEHDMIADMLLGKINNPKDLVAYASQGGY
jgi:hypothetical protein